MSRILAVLSAILLVGAVALATFGVRALSLDAALRMVDRGFVTGMQDWIARNLGVWTWSHLMQPFLVRPAWLVPAFLGLVCSGLAVSLSYRGKAKPSHRRDRGPGTGR